jgi:hypothetical protein
MVPWLGTRGLLTLELHARCDGIPVERDLLSITYKKTSFGRWRTHLKSIQRGNHPAIQLAQSMPIKTFEKFDAALAEDILDEANARDRLDLPAVAERASNILSGLNEPEDQP